MRGDGLMQIADAMVSVNQRVNLIGVVVESSIPKRSKGTDFFCSVKIIDESRTSGGYVHFFTESMESLPQVENVGDVLVARNFKVKTWKGGETYAEFNKKFSYFALFDGRDSSITELVPYQISSRYEPRDRDKEFIMTLRKWSIQQNISVLHESLLLREIKEADQLNLLCKILYISNANDNEPMLFVWDGTDTPPAPLEAKLEDEMDSPLPLQIEPCVLSRDILCTFPAVGTVLRMSVDQGGQMLGLHYLKPNRWVKLTNVKCKVRASLWTAVLQPFSKVCHLRDDEDAVIDRLRSHNVRVASKWRRMPFTSFPWPSHVTETGHPDLAFVTLMDVLTYPEVTYTFKCVVRVVAIYPWSAEDLCSPRGIYRVRLTLEDPTGRLHAYLYAEDGVNFFGDVQSVDMLTTKLNKLLGVGNEDGMLQVENVTRNPPWIQCCLFSYYTDGSDVWGTRTYRIFDTTCLADHDGLVGL